MEEQIRILVQRQREHEEIIRHHQLLQEQLNQQKNEQQRIHLEEQRRRQRIEQEAQVQRQQQQAQVQSQQPQAQALVAPPPQNSNSVSVQFIPSVQVGHTVGISVEQQPPFKDPIEFHPENPNIQKNIQRFQFRQFQQQQQRNNAVFGQSQQQLPQAQPLIQKVEVQQLTPVASPLPTSLELPVRNAAAFNQQVSNVLPTNLELPQKPVQQFQQFQQQTQNVLPPLTDIVAPSQTRPRVFRNDALQTGNFGFNNNNNVQIQQHQVRAVDNSFDNQLFNQFLQHGINTRSTEDFRLISKILAYNHGTNQQQQNVLFANNQG